MKQVHTVCGNKAKETCIKFGVEVQRSYKDAIRLDKFNGNTLWQDAIKTDLDQISSYRTFKNVRRNVPQGQNPADILTKALPSTK